ncbi:MAG: tRNA (adenosine(37)-N6)-threonylcarbamoyltransferase complex transferase subunit TsaD [Candidatus Peribacteraceae bacterium]|nr:tRNA (adenosine(37)-N6)-threonylcarbamoyltransferase complex transferase subunit TsaD [Candidatus Peribacteraceae bacterium]MDD5074836.1 tRNA (adenosine(37)-N6)-threonylcarbamoyltransferase complex transferase subunit TsaD [Candidatus Peribacteraceae bacterium]
MRILGLETSCDETSAAIVENGTRVLGIVIASSRDAFARSGGVIPEYAAREQLASIHPVIDQALQAAGMGHEDLDAIAVTRGPGLLGSLLVGTVTARALAALWKKPLIGVHHTLGHLSSTWLDCPDAPLFPILTLSASGGHTELWLRTAHTKGRLLGRTRDDAAGEAFDKGASLLGLPYPGGPAIGRLAESGNPSTFAFPLPLAHEETLDFSFSGLKTSLKYTMRDLTPDQRARPSLLADLAASYQNALCMHLVDRMKHALEQYPDVTEIHATGGVAANTHLRALLTKSFPGRAVRFPQKIVYCTDNGAMIAAAAEFSCSEQQERLSAPFMTSASLPLADALR